MASEEEKQSAGKGFTVQDRRRFSPETGEARESTAATETGAERKESAMPAAESTPELQHEELPEINFSAFVISLSTQALMNLGEIADPLTGKVEPDVAVAKQMIDIIGMLKDKTKGNLNASEDRLVEDILFDLRMKYVEAVKKR
jgi:hypothetical protein